MKSAIRINHINKKYNDDYIIKNFSYSFNIKGLYILLGESGSGKTTLLNIIAGAISFDSGNVTIYNNIFSNKVNYDYSQNIISYITQNNYFVDYLTVYDNLVLCSTERSDKIMFYLKQFNLEDKIYNYPNELSGGEQQRVAIIAALLQNKKIILMDEPTASLDVENRTFIFELLKELKNDVLIICATHDLALKEIADEIIDFSCLSSKKNDFPMADSEVSEFKRKNLIKFMLKNLFYKHREKKSGFFLTWVFIIIFLILFACFDYGSKIESGLLKNHNINFVKYYCNISSEDYCQKNMNNYNVAYNLFDYSANVPLGKLKDDVIRENVDYNITAKTLPYNKNLIPDVERYILYGTYYNTVDEIILGYDLASKLNNDVESLIGTDYKINLSDGEHTFKICGIFKDLSDKVYFKALFENIDYNDYEYLNSKFVEKYKYDGILGFNELENNHAYMIAFFNDSDSLYNFYSENIHKSDKNPHLINAIDLDYGFLNFKRDIQFLQYYSYPIIIFSFVISIIFYFQTQSILNKYNNHILAVYNYYGYKWKKIILSQSIINVISVLMKFICAAIISIFIMNVSNYIILKYNFLDFKLFLVDYINMIKLGIVLILFSIFFSIINNLKLKKHGWINVLKSGDDLL